MSQSDRKRMHQPSLTFKYIWMFLAVFWVSTRPHRAHAHAVPSWDPLADGMIMQPAVVPPTTVVDDVPYYARFIPQHVHQVWFGDLGRWVEGDHRQELESTSMWRAYARDHGLQYTLWTDADVPTLSAMMDDDLQRLFAYALATRYFTLASEIARLVIVATLGGMYFDCDMQPPHTDAGPVDLGHLFPRKGLVLTTERYARSVGNTGIFVANGMILASPEHPVLRHLVNHLARHAWHWTEMHGYFESMYIAGCVPLNRSLAGAFTIVSLDDLYALGVMHEVSPHWVAAPE